MATIVTYNRTAAPHVDGEGGPVTFFTDFMGEHDAAFFTATDFAVAAGENGVFKNADGSDASTAISSVLNTPNLSEEGDYIAFAMRAKFSARNSGDIFNLGIGDDAGVSTALSHALAFTVTQGAAATADTITGAFDDNSVENDTAAIVGDTLFEGYDSTDYHVYAAEVRVSGGKLSCQWYVDGKALTGDRHIGAAVGTHEFTAARMGLFLQQAAETALLEVDWIKYEATRK